MTGAESESGSESGFGFETRAIHAGQAPDPATGAVVPPVVLASTFAQSDIGVHQGYEYARSGNPTRAALEACVASLEGAAHGLAFSSGLAAEDAVLRLLAPGDHVVLSTDAYGGTFRLIDKVHTHLRYTAAPVAEAWQPETRLVWLETPTNPRLDVVDIAAVAAMAHERGAIVVVDNTFATPYLQTPLALGADVVVHSSTKYLGGHSDVVGGFAATNDDAIGERLRFFQNAAGAVPGPFDCYLVLRGVKTLGVRMDRHAQNAAAVVALLRGHPAVEDVYYPDRSEVAARQMRGFGGMVSFTLRGGETPARRVAAGTKVFTLAESLGAVESLIEHPAAMTHASAAGSPLEISPALVRLSVGIETVDDLLADLAAALDAVV
ncbi:MAG: cystathionine gamma-synthase [Acidimicrobiaceae bacterium]|jgi:cystathionine gamma-synthase|nr:cystathionine gamma-synthase [Acidimicrobiaceae bacterium]